MINSNISSFISAIVLLEKADYKFVERTKRFDPYVHMFAEEEGLIYKKGRNTVEISTDEKHVYIKINNVAVKPDELWEIRQFVGIFVNDAEKNDYLKQSHPYPIFTDEEGE